MNTSSRNACWSAMLLGLLTFALFAPALRYGFTDIDDVQYTLETPQVVSGLSLPNVRWAFTTVHESWYSPLLWVSYMADSSLFGPGPFGHHLTNILLHAVNAMLLCWILCRLFHAPRAAFFAAALWSLHPLRVESVVWIAERKDVLSGFFFLLSIGAYLRCVERPAHIRRLTVFLAMLAGLLSKTSLVVLPPLLLLLDAWPLRRAPFPASARERRLWIPLLREKGPLYILMLAGIVLTLITHRHAHDLAPPLSLPARGLLIAPTYGAHLARVVWPADLSLFYPVAYPSVLVSLAAFFLLLAFLFVAWSHRNSFPGLLVGGLWFGIALFPLIRGIRFDEQSASPDRYTYLPTIGLSLAFAALFMAISSRSRRHRWLSSLLAVLLVAACAARSTAYMPQWNNQGTLGPVLLQRVPDNPLVNNMYGKWLAAQNKPDQAIPHFQKAAHWNIGAACNLVTALLQTGRLEEALLLAQTICASPQAPAEAFLSLGLCYLQLDQAPAAIPSLQRATQLMPTHPLAWQMLYRAHLEAHHPVDAQACLDRLRDLHDTRVQDFDGLVQLYTRTWRDGDARLAWPFFANNVSRYPHHVLLHNNAAWLLATTENPPAPPSEAVRLARIALAAAGEPHPALLDTLAVTLAANGDFDSAIQAARRALALATAQTSETRALRESIQQRLELYQREIPYREPASPTCSR